MLDKNVMDMLNQELDGTNSDRERVVVRKLLERNQEARRYFEELQSMASILKDLKDVEPPSTLKRNVLKTLETRQTRRVPVSSLPFLHALTSNLHRRSLYAFAGGALAGIVLFAIFTSAPSSTDQLVGTMAGQPTSVAAEAQVEFNVPHPIGSLQASKTGSVVTADLQMRSSKPLDVSFFFDPQVLRFDSFRREQQAGDRVVILEGEVRIVNVSNNDYSMTFLSQREERPIFTAQIRDGDALISEYKLTLEPKKPN